MEARARTADENYRIARAAAEEASRAAHWEAMIRDRFGDNAVYDIFAQYGSLTALELESIYAGYDPNRAAPPAMSLSSAGHSLSTMLTPVVTGTVALIVALYLWRVITWKPRSRR